MSVGIHKLGRAVLKIFLGILALVVLILLLLVAALQFDSVQRFITQKAVHAISDKTHSKVELGKITLGFPKSIVLKDLYVEDLSKDTLLYFHRLAVDVAMLKLLGKTIEINSVELEELTGNVYRSMPDSTYNFDFIIQAFSSPDTSTTPKDTSGASWKFVMDKIHLSEIRFNYEDETAGLSMKVNLGDFKTHFKTFDLDRKQFYLGAIALSHTAATLEQSQDSPPSEDTASYQPIAFDVSASGISLNDVHFKMQTVSQLLNVNIGKSSIKVNTINLPMQQIDLNQFTLANSDIGFALTGQSAADSTAGESASGDQPSGNAPPWMVKLDRLRLSNNQFVFDNLNAAPVKEGIDFNHLRLTGINTDISKIRYAGSSISADINDLQVADQCGLAVRHFRAEVTYDSVHAELANLDLETANSRIRKYLFASYPSLSSISDSLAKLAIKVDLDHSVIGLADLYYFQPELIRNLKIQNPMSRSVELSAKLSGNVGDLHIPLFEARTASSTSLRLNGNIRGLPEMQYAFFDVNLNSFTASSKDVYDLVPSLIPESISIPPSVFASGKFKGSLEKFLGSLQVRSSYGNATANVQMNPGENYDASAEVDRFDVGKLLKEPETFGPVTVSVNANGQGFSPDSMKGHAEVAVREAVFKKYRYTNIELQSDFNGRNVKLESNARDPNVVYDLQATLNLDTLNPRYQANLNLQGIDLQALHFTDDDLRVQGVLVADIKGKELSEMNGEISIVNAAVTKNDTLHPIDSIVLVAASQVNLKTLDLNSPFLLAHYEGNAGIGEVASLLANHINQHFALGDTAAKQEMPERHFQFDVTIRNSELYSIFLPELRTFASGKIAGNFNSTTDLLYVEVNLPLIQYGALSLDSLNLLLNSDQESMSYSLSLIAVAQSDYKILHPRLAGVVKNNVADVLFTTRDKSDELKYRISAELKKANEDLELKLLPEDFMLNHQAWTVSEDNYLHFGKSGFYIHDLALSYETQLLQILSEHDDASSALNLGWKDFELGTLANLLEAPDTLVTGTLNGTVVLKNLQTAPSYTADLTIGNFSFQNDTIGTITVVSNNETPDRYFADVKVQGYGNDIAVNGYYTASTTPVLDFDINLANVNLATLEAYTFGQLSRLSGSLKGTVAINGSPSSPNLDGNLLFSDAGMKLNYINTYYRLNREEIRFDNNKVTFNNFTLRDSLNASAVINGYVATDPKQLVIFNLQIATDHFLAINAPKSDSSILYGRVVLSSKLSITGNKDAPKVTAHVKLEDGSALSVNRPPEDIRAIESNGVVIFVTHRDTFSQIMTRVKRDTASTARQTRFNRMEVYASIEFNQNSSLSVIIDPKSGDSLFLKGDATLSYTIDPSGKSSLTGRYEVSEGTYHLSFYQFVKRKFKLEKGSSLTWNGDLLEAELDLKALYEVKTSPIDLIADQITGLSADQKMSYQQRMLFELYMIIKGELLKPEISFMLDLPPSERGVMGGSVYAKLNELNNDESALNKQVFSLLVLNRFLAEDPFHSQQQGSFQNFARSSASGILSDELNKLTGKYVKGVEINLNLESYEDYSTGDAQAQTQLEYGVTKHLFRDRLNVQVGGNVYLEGEGAQQNTISNLVGDIEADYKITPEGTYQLRAYRRDEFDVLQGEVVETALGIVFTKDYDRRRDLFKRNKKPDNNGKAKTDQ